MKAAKLFSLLGLVMPIFSITKNLIDTSICPSSSCMKCQIQQNATYSGLSCDTCYQVVQTFVDSSDPGKGYKCTSTALSGNCLYMEKPTLAPNNSTSSSSSNFDPSSGNFTVNSNDRRILVDNPPVCKVCKNGYYLNSTTKTCMTPPTVLGGCLTYQEQDFQIGSFVLCTLCDQGYILNTTYNFTEIIQVCQPIENDLKIKHCRYQKAVQPGQRPQCNVCQAGYVPSAD
jgi:hypothetical protein